MNWVEETAVRKYKKALMFHLAHLPTADVERELQINEALVAADLEIRELGLERTPKYEDAVLRAEADAYQIRSGL
jgi:hypothetical protein